MTLAQLLVVQNHDSTIDRLTHSRTTLPELAALVMLDDEQSHLDAQRLTVAADRAVVAREQKRLEDAAALITDRINLENERLYNGSVTGHKDLQAIQEEVATLGRRRSDIEDQVLESMEQAEPLDATLDELDVKLDDVQTRRDLATESRDASLAAIEAQVESESAARSVAISEVDAALVEIYEASRAACQGIGIVRLIDKTCQGCHLTLPSVEYDRVRKEPEDAIVRCGECNRILVR